MYTTVTYNFFFDFSLLLFYSFFCCDIYKSFYSVPAGGNSLIAACSFSKKNKLRKKSSHECILLLQPKENTIKQFPNSCFFLLPNYQLNCLVNSAENTLHSNLTNKMKLNKTALVPCSTIISDLMAMNSQFAK